MPHPLKRPTAEERNAREALADALRPGDVFPGCYGLFNDCGQIILDKVYLFEADAWEDASETDRIAPLRVVMGADRKFYPVFPSDVREALTRSPVGKKQGHSGRKAIKRQLISHSRLRPRTKRPR